jgi:CheY-like chemotaxis protein
VLGDQTCIKQVMLNLLSNAIKYNRAGGEVRVCCAISGEKHLRISVEDTGAGLAPDQLSQLFQPFNRLGQEYGSVEGTGIGLVVSKHLIKLMGGTIGANSSVGSGSVFWFELEVSSAPNLASGNFDGQAWHERESDQAGELAAQRTLLYVEDNQASRALVEALIGERNDLKLLTAIEGQMGIRMARNSQPDLILMDINLPDISGVDALRMLREDPATARIPVMALTAKAITRDIERGLDAGFIQYITKPIKVDEFMNSIDMALRNLTGR